MVLTGRNNFSEAGELSEIHNYYERLVIEHALVVLGNTGDDVELLPDVVCVALNHLPPRYVRHDVDASFYLSPQERDEMERRIQEAVKDAIEYVRSSVARRSLDSEE
ncbi:MAG: late competence development ComFB family protein [Pseudomonadales bacterium]|nr:late competence development ComFB family protein [Pseudomonadales bacterium]